jgi:hypothetical protein
LKSGDFSQFFSQKNPFYESHWIFLSAKWQKLAKNKNADLETVFNFGASFWQVFLYNSVTKFSPINGNFGELCFCSANSLKTCQFFGKNPLNL